MLYTSIPYKDLTSYQREIFFEFLRVANKETTQPAHENMWNDDWQNQTHTLPYLLEKTDRFSIGGIYNVVFDGDIVVACSGIYTSTFCIDLVIAGTRTWINKEYRNKSISRDILAAEKLWAINNNFKAVGICFNDYNKNIINIWKRRRLGEKRTPRMPHHLFFNGINEVSFPVNIQYTKQWLIYEKLEEDFDFNWNDIEWKN
jgi:hypothetical protein